MRRYGEPDRSARQHAVRSLLLRANGSHSVRGRAMSGLLLALWVVAQIGATIWTQLDTTGQVKFGSVCTIIVLLASLSLTKSHLQLLFLVVAACVVVIVIPDGLGSTSVTVSGIAVISVAVSVAWLQARRRERLGLVDVSAETVIESIRDRLVVQAQLPDIGAGWLIEVAQRPADGAAISGDFVATRLLTEDGGLVLHIAVVDVSGSGIEAGPPALLLSGAVGGLLGTVEPDRLLQSANAYLFRQHWSLGFASASYVRLELSTGRYEIRVAGHPPAVHLLGSQGSPHWRESRATGTLLGVIPTIAGTADSSVLSEGDALIVYTDGLVEDRTRDLDHGLLRLKSRVELLAARGAWSGAAADLVERVPQDAHDDRTVLIIRREQRVHGTDGTGGAVTEVQSQDAGGSLQRDPLLRLPDVGPVQ